MDEDKSELLEFRLSNIEKSLTKLEDLLTNNKLQDRDIDDLKDCQGKLEDRIVLLEERCRKLEEAPFKAKADKWGQTMDIIYKLVLSGAMTALLVKVGL